MISADKFDLYLDGMLARIRTDEAAFRMCITANIVRIALEYECDVSVSRSRLGDVFVYWDDDLNRVLGADTDERTTQLDHFKQTAFLSFWLRRHVPVGHIFQHPRVDTPIPLTAKQKFFTFYGNETCALRIGLELCHAFEVKRLQSIIQQADPEKVQALEGVRQQLISSEIIDPGFEVDFVSTLKHKNNSPHSMNLIFRSIFMNYRNLRRPVLI